MCALNFQIYNICFTFRLPCSVSVVHQTPSLTFSLTQASTVRVGDSYLSSGEGNCFIFGNVPSHIQISAQEKVTVLYLGMFRLIFKSQLRRR